MLINDNSVFCLYIMISQLNQILTRYLKTNDATNYSVLENIPQFREFFLDHLRTIWKTSEENLETRFRICCRDLSRGKAWKEMRLGAVYGLWFRCNLKQYQIAKLLNVNVRTIRRDMRELEEQILQ